MLSCGHDMAIVLTNSPSCKIKSARAVNTPTGNTNLDSVDFLKNREYMKTGNGLEGVRKERWAILHSSRGF